MLVDSFAKRLSYLRRKYGPPKVPSGESSRAGEERGNKTPGDSKPAAK